MPSSEPILMPSLIMSSEPSLKQSLMPSSNPSLEPGPTTSLTPSLMLFSWPHDSVILAHLYAIPIEG
eukprot:12171187-Ditylum_brightwellii.AAC.1